MFSLLDTERTPSSMKALWSITVPWPSGFIELSTITGIFLDTAGSMVLGWRTLAPYAAISAASSKEMRLMRRVLLTLRGSALWTPSTSVHISILDASMAIPMMEAL